MTFPTTRVVRTAEALTFLPDPSALLTGAERSRAAAFIRDADADDFIGAHVLARLLVAERVGAAPAQIELAQRCSSCGGPHGRPHVVGRAGVHVSWAHSRGWVAAMAADEPCGIDVEPADRPPPPGRDLRWWVRQEALVKAGAGDLDSVPVDPTGYVVKPLHIAGAVAAAAVRRLASPGDSADRAVG